MKVEPPNTPPGTTTPQPSTRVNCGGKSVSLLLLLILLALVLAAWNTAWADPQQVPVYKMKTVYIYNFLSFIELPSRSDLRDDRSYRLCVLDSNQAFSALSKLELRKFKDKPLVVSQLPQGADLSQCHILFVPKTMAEKLTDIVASPKGLGILTIGEVPGFSELGGIINFFVRGNRLRFEVNLKRAQSEGIRIEAKMLKRATIVQE